MAERNNGTRLRPCNGPPHDSLVEKNQKLPGLFDGIRRNHFDSCLRTVHGG